MLLWDLFFSRLSRNSTTCALLVPFWERVCIPAPTTGILILPMIFHTCPSALLWWVSETLHAAFHSPSVTMVFGLRVASCDPLSATMEFGLVLYKPPVVVHPVWLKFVEMEGRKRAVKRTNASLCELLSFWAFEISTIVHNYFAHSCKQSLLKFQFLLLYFCYAHFWDPTFLVYVCLQSFKVEDESFQLSLIRGSICLPCSICTQLLASVHIHVLPMCCGCPAQQAGPEMEVAWACCRSVVVASDKFCPVHVLSVVLTLIPTVGAITS